MSIYNKLLELQKAVVGMTKDKVGNSYQYVSGDKILGIVRPQMDKLGLLLTKDVVEYSFTPFEYQVKTGMKKEMFCALKIRFTWIDVETGEKLTAEVIAIHRFGSFAELYQELHLLKCGYTESDITTAKPEDMNLYYTSEQQEKYGVLGIELKVLNQ